MALALWRRPPRLAPRVLGDVDEIPGRNVRYTLRRWGFDLSASRKRDRAVRRSHRQNVCTLLGAYRISACRRREDVEVQGELLHWSGAYRTGVCPDGDPLHAFVCSL